ncbi:MAG: tyrosine-type recombinase/integrase family protein [Thermomicrobiales bacterium]|nr:tyrosine-type recombinase/integrase family protein [Thermomicrobiales bacterium]
MPKKRKNPRRTLQHGQGWVEVRGPTTAAARWREGSRVRSRNFHGLTLDEAYAKAQRHVDLETAHRVNPDTVDWTVADVVEGWLRRGKSRWTTNTYSQYRFQYRAHIEDELGKLRARDLTSARLQRWIDDLNAQQLQPATVRLIYAVMQGALKEAARLEIIRTNPATGLVLPTIRRRPKQTWTVEHIQQVFVVVADDAFWNALYRFALTTAVRPGELVTVRWSDLDLESGHVTIARTLTRGEDRRYVIGNDTKTKQPRSGSAIYVPINVADDDDRDRIVLCLWALGYEAHELEDGGWNGPITTANIYAMCDLDRGEIDELRRRIYRSVWPQLFRKDGERP